MAETLSSSSSDDGDSSSVGSLSGNSSLSLDSSCFGPRQKAPQKPQRIQSPPHNTHLVQQASSLPSVQPIPAAATTTPTTTATVTPVPPQRIVLPLAPPCGHLVDDDDEEEEDEEDEQTIGSNSTAPQMEGRAITIRFRPDATLAMFHEGADIDALAANRHLVWYQYEELKSIKRKTLQISKEAQRHGLGAILTNTYGRKCEETQQALNTWARNASHRRGLERWINDEYAARRSDIRKRTIQSVVRAQAKMKDSEMSDPDYSVKVLSRLSEAFSIDSRQFARGMGVADELVAYLERNDIVAPTTMTTTTATTPSTTKLPSDNFYPHQSGRKTPYSRSSSERSYQDVKALFRKSSLRNFHPGRPVVTLNSHHHSTTGSTSSGGSSTTPPHDTTLPKGKGIGMGRSVGLTSPSVSADFRHYF